MAAGLTLKKVLFFVFTLVMFGCFMRQCQQCIQKLIDGSKLEMRLKEFVDEIELPAITICPKGVKPDQERPPRWSNVLGSYCLDGDEEERITCWNSITYNIEEVIDSFSHDHVGDLVNRTKVTKIFSPTLYHLTCWMFEFDAEIDPWLGLKGLFYVKLKANHEVVLYFHDRRVFPFNLQSPKEIPYSASVFSWRNVVRHSSMMLLQKSVITKQSDCEADENYSLFDCLRDKAREISGCEMPTFKLSDVLEDPTIASRNPSCPNISSHFVYNKKFLLPLMFGTFDYVEYMTECEPLCRVAHYEAERFHLLEDNEVTNPDYLDSMTGHNIIMMAYKNGDVYLESEVPLYDWNNFIGEVGGSLGFFMGASLFTVFNMGKDVIGGIFNKFSGKKNDSRVAAIDVKGAE